MSDLQWAVVLVFFAGTLLFLGGQKLFWQLLALSCLIAGIVWIMRLM